MEETAEILTNLYYSENAKIVFSKTEDRGGRWTKWEIKVYEVPFEKGCVYFQVEEEVGATEYQSDGSTIVREVEPREITITEYVVLN